MKKSYIIIIIIGLLALSCNNEAKQPIEITKSFDKIEQLQWLIGNWTNITKEEQSFENWTKRDDSTWTAHSFTLIENDTVFAERVILQQKEEDVYFTAVAYNQNDDKTVTFKLIPSEIGVFTFENKHHDFPSLINYSNPVKDSIHAWIEGKVKGEELKVDFYFKRN